MFSLRIQKVSTRAFQNVAEHLSISKNQQNTCFIRLFLPRPSTISHKLGVSFLLCLWEVTLAAVTNDYRSVKSDTNLLTSGGFLFISILPPSHMEVLASCKKIEFEIRLYLGCTTIETSRKVVLDNTSVCLF